MEDKVVYQRCFVAMWWMVAALIISAQLVCNIFKFLILVVYKIFTIPTRGCGERNRKQTYTRIWSSECVWKVLVCCYLKRLLVC